MQVCKEQRLKILKILWVTVSWNYHTFVGSNFDGPAAKVGRLDVPYPERFQVVREPLGKEQRS